MSDAKAEPRVYNYFELLPEQDRFRGVEFVKKNDFDRANLLNVFYLEGLEKAQSELANLKAELEAAKARVNRVADLWTEDVHMLRAEVEKLRVERDIYLNSLKDIEMAPRILHKDNLAHKMQLIADMALSEGAKLAERKDD